MHLNYAIQTWELGMRRKEMKIRNALAVLSRRNSEAARHREHIGALNFNRKGETIMRRCFVLAGLLLFTSGAVLAQESYSRVETAPAFMYIRTSAGFNPFVVNGRTITPQALNCAGGGGTIAYNFSSLIGLAADLGGCKIFSNAYGAGNTVDGNEFTYLFGPRLTYRSGSRFEPFVEVNFGGMRISVSCKSSALSCVNATGGNTFTKNAFALTAGGGFQIKLSHKFSLRLVQAEYLYTRFGNSCGLAVCSNNNSQNSFRLKSGIVINW
jgi:opacity protein-like surface antigen